jgi:hypothetical protein
MPIFTKHTQQRAPRLIDCALIKVTVNHPEHTKPKEPRWSKTEILMALSLLLQGLQFFLPHR